MYRLVVSLPKDRRAAGRFSLLSPGGSVMVHGACLGKADNQRAAKEGNPKRSTTLPYGDTPTGRYAPARVREFDPPHRTLGPWAIPLIGEEGDALEAMRDGGEDKPPRDELYVHAGRGDEKLIPTYGCLRLLDRDLVKIANIVGQELVEVTIDEKAVEHA